MGPGRLRDRSCPGVIVEQSSDCKIGSEWFAYKLVDSMLRRLYQVVLYTVCACAILGPTSELAVCCVGCDCFHPLAVIHAVVEFCQLNSQFDAVWLHNNATKRPLAL
eukprot:1060122-Amphidinium_carterae.1